MAKAKVAKAKAKAAKPAVAADPDPARAELLAAIVAHPDDKKPRTVYADHLQDHDDPRGEFISLQCARADLPADDARVAEILAREEQLLKKHKKAWTAFGDTKGARWEFRRGFVEKASLDASALARHGEAIFAAEPIEELNVWKIDEASLAPVVALPLHHVKRLSLARSELSVADYEALATAKTLGRVELLDLSYTKLGDTLTGAIEAFAKTRSLPALRELRISGAYLSDDDLVVLSRSTTLRFERFIAPNNFFGARGLAAVARAPWAKHLTHLDFSSHEGIGLEGLEAIAAGTFPALKSLRLEYAGIWIQEPDTVAALLASPVIRRLEHLDLSQNSGAELLRPGLGDRLKE